LKLSKPESVKFYPEDYSLDPLSMCHPAWSVRCV